MDADVPMMVTMKNIVVWVIPDWTASQSYDSNCQRNYGLL